MTSSMAHPLPIPTPPRGIRETHYVGRHRLTPAELVAAEAPTAMIPVVQLLAPTPPKRSWWARTWAAVTGRRVTR